MFTGIVQTTAIVLSATPNSFGMRLTLDAAHWSYRPAPGDSIAVNGVCLTYAPQNTPPGQLVFDAIRETLDHTTLGSLKTGDRVNLEPALTASTPLGGHFVQGHVDAVGRVITLQRDPSECRLTIQAEPTLMRFVIPKGSITIDGVSLTIASVDVSLAQFTVALIPTTLELTNLAVRAPGQRVNLETDMIVRSLVHYLEHFIVQGSSSSLTLDKLRNSGFLV